MVDDVYPDWDISMPLLKIAMAEAESESTETKAQVMRTVAKTEFGVMSSRTHRRGYLRQRRVYPVSNGRYSKVEPDDDRFGTRYDVNIDGWDKSQGALYFETPLKTAVHGTQEPV